MRNLLLNPFTSFKDLEDYIRDELNNEKKELCLYNIRLDSYTEEQITHFLEVITTTGVTSLSFKNNHAGSTVSLSCWQTFCHGLINSSVRELKIDDNQLYQFGVEYWQALDYFIEKRLEKDSDALELLSLQNNNLVELSEESHQVLNSLIHRLDCPRLISFNNWCKNLLRWGELTSIVDESLAIARRNWFTENAAKMDTQKVEVSDGLSINPS
ncbi:hypothetical protein [Legionella micdadei]|uniref:Uncharacterized protein n=1 Tax=Legionella micdadei TaxID=451 RepID=A0A098GKR5_LEGMI|nr:hypothetical protein [Legionella micdadei]ARH01297.1 hypothetical protein B6V88_13315 [Legionella micdadei]KTD27413.1 hypothetical protein Lmic_2348 [Legionella micdadei]NSL19377.1 hypothetical protein [Legionella micdadei]CEG62121.1 protein of unknown function [Legionella micdadei]SCY74141.1 hypothetical protein SAMN02982997_02738 [Legionella micdadei]